MQDRFVHSITQIEPKLADAILPMLDSTFSGHLTHQQITELMAHTNMDEPTLLLALLPIAASLANPPISEFYVGAIVKGQSGDIYMGANIELNAEALYNSIHAEQHAISHAWLCGETGISDIYVNFSPCGHCRQFINEIANASEIRIHLPHQPTAPLSHYLPYAFGPNDLNVTRPLLINAPVTLMITTDDPIVLEAIEQANNSYAPYSQCYAGVIIEMFDGTTFAGRYSENAAFNPSMLPLQMAWANLLRHNANPIDIKRVIIVESNTGKISLVNATQTALAAISPVTLEHIIAELA